MAVTIVRRATDTTAPAVPTGLSASAGASTITVTWNANSEADFRRYTLLKSTDGVGYGIVAQQVTTGYTDLVVISGAPYYYRIFSEDTSGNPSALSSAVSATITAALPSADWVSRISQPGVVWYHSFDTAAEVNQFRWANGVGNSPTSVSTYQANWVASGGADGGGYMQITRAAGTSEPADWWRPFNPLTASSNGRGTADPGAPATVGGAATITPVAWNPTQGGSQTSDWQGNAKPGWYGNAAYQNSFFDGTDFYLQVRVMTDPRRTQQAPGSYTNQMTGKQVWITTTSASQCEQEIVTNQSFTNKNITQASGIPNYHNGYFGHGFEPWSDASTVTNGTRIQLGSEVGGVCDPYAGTVGGCWEYATDGTWDTLLYHITPGTDGGTGTGLTRFEVWAAHADEVSYTKIWDIQYSAFFQQGVSSSGKPYRNGWNGLLLSGYNNGFLGFSQPEFWMRYDQVIFSKQPIACPAETKLATLASGMTSGQWLQMTGANLPSGLNLFTSLGNAFSGGSSGTAIAFTDKFVRDATNKKFYFSGSDHFGLPGPANAHTVLLAYDDATNAWTLAGYPPYGTSPGGGGTPAHGYENSAFDSTRGKFWHHYAYGGTTLRRWDGGSTWFSSYTSGSAYSGDLGSMEYFPNIDRLVYYGVESGTNGVLVSTNPATGAHTTLVSSASGLLSGTGLYQYFLRYSAVRGLVYFGGGSGSSRCWTYNAAGTLVRQDDMPLPINCGGAPTTGTIHCFVNPSNGNLVAYRANAWYELDPSASAGNQWTQKAGSPSSVGAMMASNNYDTSGGAYGTMSCVTEYGVVAFVKAYSGSQPAQMWLWKP